MDKDLNSTNSLDKEESILDSQSKELENINLNNINNDINLKKNINNRKDKAKNNGLYEQDKMEAKAIFIMGVVGLILQITLIFILFSLITNMIILIKFWTTNWESSELKNNLEIYKILSIIGLFIPFLGPLTAIYFGDKYKE
ncbi:MAG: hypothetical protein ACRCW6_00275 [Mycoplasmoidaceae bacterium]